MHLNQRPGRPICPPMALCSTHCWAGTPKDYSLCRDMARATHCFPETTSHHRYPPSPFGAASLAAVLSQLRQLPTPLSSCPHKDRMGKGDRAMAQSFWVDEVGGQGMQVIRRKLSICGSRKWQRTGDNVLYETGFQIPSTWLTLLPNS